MILRSNTVVSSMARSKISSSRNSSSSDEMNNEGEQSYCYSASRTSFSFNSHHQLSNNYSSTKRHEYCGHEYNANVWLATWFCATSGYSSSNTNRIGASPNSIVKFVVHKLHYGQFTPSWVTDRAFDRPRIECGEHLNGPHIPNMLRLMPLTAHSYINESLATFRQQLEESHHELVNMLMLETVTRERELNRIVDNSLYLKTFS